MHFVLSWRFISTHSNLYSNMQVHNLVLPSSCLGVFSLLCYEKLLASGVSTLGQPHILIYIASASQFLELIAVLEYS